MDPTLRKLSTKFVMSATMSSSLAAKEASSWSRVDLDRPKLGELSEAEVSTSVPTSDGGDVTEARMPAKAGEVLAKSRSLARGTEDCRRVSEVPTSDGGVAKAELNEVAEAEVPSEDGEVMDATRSLAIGTEDCRRVEAVK